MSKRYTRNMVAAAAAVLAASLGVTSALAATTWTVRPGGSISLKSGTLVMKDTRTGSTLSCTSTRFSGRLKSGGGRSGTGIGAITAGSFTNCTSPLGVTYFFTPTDLPWHVNFTSYHATNGVVTGNISHIQITQSSPGCAFVIDGTSATASDGVVTFTYANSTARLKTLTTGGNLHIYNVYGCAGLFAGGDPLTISGTSTVSPKQVITSP